MQIERKDYTVVVTEIDQHGNKTKVIPEKGCRFTTRDDGSLVVFDPHDREVGAWAKAQWVKVGSRLKAADGEG